MDTTVSNRSADYAAVETLINSVSDTEYVEHHGIPGMKWGVRRSQETLDRLAGRSRATAAEVKKKASNAKSAAGAKIKERRADRKVVKKANRKAKVEIQKAKAKGKVEIEKAKIDRKVNEARTGSDQKTPSERAPAKSLTDKELKARVERLNLEKQYRTLTAKPKSTTDVVKDFAVKQGAKFATKAADALVQQAVNSIIKSPSHSKGENALSEIVEAASKTPTPKKTTASITKAITPSTLTKSMASIKPRNTSKVDELIRAYTYVGRRRLNKDRKVTNRR